MCVYRTNISEHAGHSRVHPVMHDICNNVGWGLSIAKRCSSLLSRPLLFVVFTGRSRVHGCFYERLASPRFSFGYSLQFPCNLRCTAAHRRCPANELPPPVYVETEETWKGLHISQLSEARLAPKRPRLAAVANSPFGRRLLSSRKCSHPFFLSFFLLPPLPERAALFPRMRTLSAPLRLPRVAFPSRDASVAQALFQPLALPASAGLRGAGKGGGTIGIDSPFFTNAGAPTRTPSPSCAPP